MTVFDDAVELFRSEEDDETLLITCEPTGLGGIRIHQLSAGELTRWAFEESPHEIDTFVDAGGTTRLRGYYGVETNAQLARMLSVAFSDYDCSIKIRELMQCLDIPYEVVEKPIER